MNYEHFMYFVKTIYPNLTETNFFSHKMTATFLQEPPSERRTPGPVLYEVKFFDDDDFDVFRVRDLKSLKKYSGDKSKLKMIKVTPFFRTNCLLILFLFLYAMGFK